MNNPFNGIRLAQAREIRKWSLETLAGETGIPVKDLADFESKKRLPDEKEEAAIVEVFVGFFLPAWFHKDDPPPFIGGGFLCLGTPSPAPAARTKTKNKSSKH